MKNLFKPVYIVLILSLVLGECKNPKNYDFVPAFLKLVPIFVKTNTAEELSFSSADSYDDNSFGLISFRKLNQIVNNWDKTKINQLNGKVVVLQIDTTGTSNGFFIPSSAQRQVYSYYVYINPNAVSTGIFGQSRNNGVLETELIVPEGRVVDNFLGEYGINPAQDYIVIAADSSNQDSFLYSLRLYYTLRYWGLDKKNIAFLNGSVRQGVQLGEITASTSQNREIKQSFASLKSLYTDNTILQATVGDIYHAISNGTTTFENVTSIPANGIQFVDARSSQEYSPSTTTGITVPNRSRTCPIGSNCKVPFEGRIRGAKRLEWSELLVSSSTNDFRFKTKAEIKQTFQLRGVSETQTIIAYCDRGLRSNAIFFAAGAILGIPVRLYDASWIEWSSLAFDENGDGWSNLSGSSPWRSDRSGRTEGLTTTTPSNAIIRLSFQTASAFSSSSYKTREADKLYLRTVGSGSSSGGGGSSGSGASGGGGNACGG
ncbi:rhodanese-like protein [Leptospira ryugenii]|uniref:Rhodanese-like protein n=1 Tax=Leptospira ryugenii TaxID=1917863 RepID=A0A2P2E1C0_9LEPT|nr:rhodanese-like domain-containing protein [Leptospira ryugenii]GBF50683.1 rhodanese-like protein [Leptospira ryugenii]